MAQVATVVGLIWALVLVASGMVFNAGMAAVVDLQATDPAQAVSVWQAVEPVAQGLGGSGGELLGGLWVLLVSAAALRARKLPRALNWLGVVLGAVGVLSVVPVAQGLGLRVRDAADRVVRVARRGPAAREAAVGRGGGAGEAA